ncbi:CoA transferase [Paenibacillus doosanensis]|uniref:CaiB/BaiF CoA transferase family protein n=1 Tax=Paenibacillus doosanensis TaxID=1229154 RepID=UPI0021802BF3|nr:CoA transferase [Paenibacillus doosanensis]MCS7458595.1 CoA transferase [Paenibacillus doosanensis]
MNRGANAKPLEGILVLDFSQFLSGPSAALRLADLGARVIKIEKPGTGDICRTLYISDLELDGDSTLFHSINRNKEGYAADLKREEDRDRVRRLIERSDVLIQNFRPGVMERLGLHYDAVRERNPALIYAEITGYGAEGPWKDKPGQDLLVQSLSGLAWLNGEADRPPQPLGLAAVDMAAGTYLVQGVLAGLFRRSMTGAGCRVEVSLLESILDLQAAELVVYWNGGERLPQRPQTGGAHAWMPAPYGMYPTADGYIALGAGSVEALGKALDCCESLAGCADEASRYERREEINRLIAGRLAAGTTSMWLERLEAAGYPCSSVLTWEQLRREEAFLRLGMTQTVYRGSGAAMRTTRCPIRIDGAVYTSSQGSPRIGEHNESINEWLEATEHE